MNALWKCERCGKLIPYMADFCHECANKLLGEPPKPFAGCDADFCKECDWIPVSDPPKEDGDYLVKLELIKGVTYVDVLSYSHYLYSVNEFDFAGVRRPGWYDYIKERGYYEVKNVVTWKPLPETFKESEE